MYIDIQKWNGNENENRFKESATETNPKNEK